MGCARRRSPRLEVHVVRDAARVVEQVAQADPPPLANRPGRSLLTRSSSRSLRSATSCMTTVATKLFVMLPAQNRSSGRAFLRRSRRPRRDDRALAVLLDERDHGGDVARRDEPVRGPLEHGLGRRPSVGRRRTADRRRRARRSAACTHLRGERASRYTRYFAAARRCMKVIDGLRPLARARAALAPREREPEFLARAKSGDHEAYASLVRPYERLAYRVAAAITGRRADAEEAMQNGFVKAYRSLHRFRAGAAFRPWLLRIVVNEAHNVVRDRAPPRRLGARAAEQHEAAMRGPGRSGDRARGGRHGAGRARAASRSRPARARAALLRRAAGRARRPRSPARRRRHIAYASCARGGDCRRCWRRCDG